MDTQNKRLIDINIDELEHLIRRVVRQELGTTKPQNIDDEFVNIEEASRLIRYSIGSIYRMVSRREIPFHKVGPKRVVFRPEELVEWVKKNRTRQKRAKHLFNDY